MSSEDRPTDPDEILRDMADLQERKDEDYGEAYKLAGETMAFWMDRLDIETVELTSDPLLWSSIEIYSRRLEKLIRAFNGEFSGDELNFESISETHEEAGSYGAMHASIHRKASMSNETSGDASGSGDQSSTETATPVEHTEEFSRDVLDSVRYGLYGDDSTDPDPQEVHITDMEPVSEDVIDYLKRLSKSSSEYSYTLTD